MSAQSCLTIVESKSFDRASLKSKVQQITRDWTVGKFGDLRDALQTHTDFDIVSERVHVKAGLIAPEVWNFSCVHMDDSRPDWHWCTQVGLSLQGKDVMLALRNSWQGKPAEGLPQPSVPRILRTVIAQMVVRDLGGYRVRGQPSVLDSTSKFDEFVGITISQDRMLPIVVLSQLQGDDGPPYAVDIDRMATQLAGVAHVVCLPLDADKEMKGEFGKALNAYNGAVRIFEPGFTYSDEPTKHALLLPPDDVRFGSRHAMKSFTSRIESHILGNNRSYPLLTKHTEAILPVWEGFQRN